MFAVVGLLSDFFLQMVFFATVLSIDIQRKEVTFMFLTVLLLSAAFCSHHFNTRGYFINAYYST